MFEFPDFFFFLSALFLHDKLISDDPDCLLFSARFLIKDAQRKCFGFSISLSRNTSSVYHLFSPFKHPSLHLTFSPSICASNHYSIQHFLFLPIRSLNNLCAHPFKFEF